MGRFQRNIKCETRAVAKSSYGVTCYILLGYGTPGSMFSVQVSGDEDVILVSEEMVKFMDEDGFSSSAAMESAVSSVHIIVGEGKMMAWFEMCVGFLNDIWIPFS
ncbi:hypothetical protein TNIN_418391 [Trichonephila inaurata madagascariensis]|uniref:Uncharacterized protein n=1 Tax=Trichonephila inaurata madagascariensis TaxID=2747483 RepID=A0A8X6K9M5_9ARAC|nr:hypothetical protein TNIN_418391 [Trichonephila inaurata madagascariensis]